MQTVKTAWYRVKHSRAARVRTRRELDAALARAPAYIVVEGTEALRAYAASLAHRGGREAAWLESNPATLRQVAGGSPGTMAVPPVGRIRDGYRRRGLARRPSRGHVGLRWQAGLGTVAAASCGLLAALTAEWMMWPSSDAELVRATRPVPAALPRGEATTLPTQAPPPATPGQDLHQVLIVVLALVALTAMAFLLWQAMGRGRPARVSWRVDHRVQGRLVMARVRTRLA